MLSILLTAYKPPEWDLKRVLSILIALIVLLITLRLYNRYLREKEELKREELERMKSNIKDRDKEDVSIDKDK